jgi:hypothetical protein
MRQSVVVLIACLLLVGCTKPAGNAVVSGKVTYKGQPVNGASLTFNPASGTGNPVLIPVTQEGTFRSSGLIPGDYKISIQGASTTGMPSTKGMDPAKAAQAQGKLAGQEVKPTIPFPEKYKLPQTTPLTRTIKGGEQTLDLELTD